MKYTCIGGKIREVTERYDIYRKQGQIGEDKCSMLTGGDKQAQFCIGGYIC